MSPPRRSRNTKHLLSALQIAITLGILVFLFYDSAKRAQMAEALRRADWRWLLAGVFAYGAVEILGAIQWQLLLRIQGFRLPWLQATSIFFIGVFFTLFTPGLIAGDAVQILYLVKEKPERKAGAVLVVVMDRILGLLSLVVLAAVVAAARFHWLRRTAVTARLFDLTIVLLAVGLLCLIAAVPAAKSRRLHNVFSALHWADKIAEIRDALGCYLVNRRRTAIAFSLTVTAHLFYFGTFYCTGRALEGNVMTRAPSLGEIFSIMPIVNTLTALPISFAGIGVRESLFQVLLHDLSRAPEAVGVLIGALGFAIRLLWGLPGGAAFLWYRLPRVPSS